MAGLIAAQEEDPVFVYIPSKHTGPLAQDAQVKWHWPIRHGPMRKRKRKAGRYTRFYSQGYLKIKCLGAHVLNDNWIVNLMG